MGNLIQIKDDRNTLIYKEKCGSGDGNDARIEENGVRGHWIENA
jgi:hypothetical protein